MSARLVDTSTKLIGMSAKMVDVSAKTQALERVARGNNAILTVKLQTLKNIKTKLEKFKGESTLALHYKIREEQ